MNLARWKNEDRLAQGGGEAWTKGTHTAETAGVGAWFHPERAPCAW